MEYFSIRAFLAGLAMFVFGMNILEDSIKDLGYAQLKKTLTHTINTRLRAMWAGTILAGILQSGTIVSTMVIAFAGAGLISLAMGIGVIVGANVGGTFLAVIIAKLGFDYSISTWALPLLAVGGLMQFIQNKRIKLIGQLILSFGLLLFGIGYLKDSVSILAESINLTQYANMPWYIYFFGGTVLAALLHSSGTATIIAMTALTAGIITFPEAIIVMLGASLGSSLISLYVSVGGSPIKRQIAYSHVGFNVLGALLFLPFAGYVDEIMGVFMGSNNTGPDAIARFQVLYNVIAAIIVYPFIYPIARGMQRRVGGQDHLDYQLQSIHQSKNKSYLQALESDIVMLLKKIFKFNVHHLFIDQQILLDPDYTSSEKHYATYQLKPEKFAEDYEILQTIEEGLLQGLLKRFHTGDEKQDAKYLPYYEAIEHFMYSAKALDDARVNVFLLDTSDSLMICERMQTLKEQMTDLYVTVAEVIDAHSLKGNITGLKSDLKNIESANEELMELLGKYLHRQDMVKGELSALLHLTSSLQRSHKAMVKGLEKLWG